MKIICVGRNYASHARELANEVPGEPVLFAKPETALLRPGQDFYLPDFSREIHYEVELVLRIGKMGKQLQEKYALRYIGQVSVGIDFTARNLQQDLKSWGLPWEKAKAFDGSAAVGRWLDPAALPPLNDLEIALRQNGEERQKGHTGQMIFPVARLLADISRYFTLKTGDLIYTGTPAGVGPVKAGDQLDASLNGENLLSLYVK